MARKLEARKGDPPPELARRRQTVGEYYDEWTLRRRVAAGTHREDAYRFARHILPAWQDRPLAAIRPSDIDAWLVRLQTETRTDVAEDGGARVCRPLAAATALKQLNSLSALLEDAYRDGALPGGNPCSLVRRPTAGGQGIEMFWEPEEIELLLKSLDDDEGRVAVLALVDAGLRWGELHGLHRDRVNIARGTLSVVEVVAGKGAQTYLAPYPKSKRMRTVTMTPRLKKALAAHLAATQVVQCRWEHPGRRPCSGLLFTHEHPTWCRQLSLGGSGAWARRVFAPGLVASGIRPGRVHDLRHTCASWLVQDGVSLSEVAQFLGHESTRMTERYAHLAPDRMSPRLARSLQRRRGS